MTSQPPDPCGSGFSLYGRLTIKVVSYFIDGFNVFHSLDGDKRFPDYKKYHKYKWLNYDKFAKCFCPPKTNNSQIHISNIYYFTAINPWDKVKAQRHEMYIKALENVGVKTIRGKFKLADKKCRKCNEHYQTYEEKRTDVNIGVKLFQDAYKDEYDVAIIISGDTDLIPAIEAVKSSFPLKEVGVVIPMNRHAKELKKETGIADFHFKMKEQHLATCQFPDIFKLTSGEILKKPLVWR